MTMRKMTPAEIDAHGTYGTPRDQITEAYTDDAGGVMLFRACHEVTTDGKMPTYKVLERRLFQVVLAGQPHSLNTYDDSLREDMRELSATLIGHIPSLDSVSVKDSAISPKYLLVRSSQTIRGAKKDVTFGLPEAICAAVILPLVCEVVLGAARRAIAADRKREVEREAQRFLNHVGSHLWKDAEAAVNYKERLTALQTERRGAFEAARLAILANAREELSELEIKDEEVLQAVIAGLDNVKRPANTLELC